MKRTMLGLVLGLAVALFIVLIAFAGHGQPTEPTCPQGQITVTPAVWVPEECTCPVIDWHWGWHHVLVPYEKSQDPHSCHRPSDSDLHNVYGMGTSERNAFKQAHPQSLDATCTDGYWIPPVCRDPIPGCTDPLATNYNPLAEVDDGSCQYPYVQCSQTIEGQALDPTYGPWSECQEVSTEGIQTRDVTTWSVPLLDSQDPQIVCVASVPTVTIEVRSCTIEVLGCTDPEALNYNPEATVDDQSCIYPPEVIPGCTDPAASNYNPEATENDGSCQYPPPPPSCSGRIWVWHLQGQDGLWRTLRDLGYDGTYSAPGLGQQRYYFGCDFYPMPNVWGGWVTCTQSTFDYWHDLPRYSGGGACPLGECD